MKTQICYLFRNCLSHSATWGDSTNNGISKGRDKIRVFADCTPAEAETYCNAHGIDPAAVLVVDSSPVGGRIYHRAKPLKGREHCAGPMFGGAYVEFRDFFSSPIPVHDRFETWEEYDILSR